MNTRDIKKDNMWNPFIENSAIFGIYAIMFFLFSLKIAPQNITIGAACGIFLFSPFEMLPFLYFFSLPWAYVGKFSFGLTLSLVQSVLYLGRIFLVGRNFKINSKELPLFLYLLLIGFLTLVETKSLTGISMVFYFLIACYISSEYIKNDLKRFTFLKYGLFSIMISVGIAAIYGLMFQTGINRWISGFGYSIQLYGTMGTTRFGLYLCIALLYPLYYVRSPILKITLCTIIVIAILATVSVTALLLLVVVLGVYFVTKSKLNASKIMCICIIAMLLPMLFTLKDELCNISFVKPIYTRVELSIKEFSDGNIDAASSGRQELLSTAVDRFKNSNIAEKFLGSQSIKEDTALNSHNSYIDMLNYMGIIGVLLVFLLQIVRIKEYMRYDERMQLLLIKVLIIFCATSVSIFSAQYWQILLYI